MSEQLTHQNKEVLSASEVDLICDDINSWYQCLLFEHDESKPINEHGVKDAIGCSSAFLRAFTKRDWAALAEVGASQLGTQQEKEMLFKHLISDIENDDYHQLFSLYRHCVSRDAHTTDSSVQERVLYSDYTYTDLMQILQMLVAIPDHDRAEALFAQVLKERRQTKRLRKEETHQEAQSRVLTQAIQALFSSTTFSGYSTAFFQPKSSRIKEDFDAGVTLNQSREDIFTLTLSYLEQPQTRDKGIQLLARVNPGRIMPLLLEEKISFDDTELFVQMAVHAFEDFLYLLERVSLPTHLISRAVDIAIETNPQEVIPLLHSPFIKDLYTREKLIDVCNVLPILDVVHAFFSENKVGVLFSSLTEIETYMRDRIVNECASKETLSQQFLYCKGLEGIPELAEIMGHLKVRLYDEALKELHGDSDFIKRMADILAGNTSEELPGLRRSDTFTALKKFYREQPILLDLDEKEFGMLFVLSLLEIGDTEHVNDFFADSKYFRLDYILKGHFVSKHEQLRLFDAFLDKAHENSNFIEVIMDYGFTDVSEEREEEFFSFFEHYKHKFDSGEVQDLEADDRKYTLLKIGNMLVKKVTGERREAIIQFVLQDADTLDQYFDFNYSQPVLFEILTQDHWRTLFEVAFESDIYRYLEILENHDAHLAESIFKVLQDKKKSSSDLFSTYADFNSFCKKIGYTRIMNNREVVQLYLETQDLVSEKDWDWLLDAFHSDIYDDPLLFWGKMKLVSEYTKEHAANFKLSFTHFMTDKQSRITDFFKENTEQLSNLFYRYPQIDWLAVSSELSTSLFASDQGKSMEIQLDLCKKMAISSEDQDKIVSLYQKKDLRSSTAKQKQFFSDHLFCLATDGGEDFFSGLLALSQGSNTDGPRFRKIFRYVRALDSLSKDWTSMGEEVTSVHEVQLKIESAVVDAFSELLECTETEEQYLRTHLEEILDSNSITIFLSLRISKSVQSQWRHQELQDHIQTAVKKSILPGYQKWRETQPASKNQLAVFPSEEQAYTWLYEPQEFDENRKATDENELRAELETFISGTTLFSIKEHLAADGWDTDLSKDEIFLLEAELSTTLTPEKAQMKIAVFSALLRLKDGVWDTQNDLYMLCNETVARLRMLRFDQAATDVEQILKKMSYISTQGRLFARDTDDQKIMWNMGIDPVENCQSWKDGQYNCCLPAFVSDPSKRAVIVENEVQKLISFTLFKSTKLTFVDPRVRRSTSLEESALLLEHQYTLDGSETVTSLSFRVALEKARATKSYLLLDPLSVENENKVVFSKELARIGAQVQKKEVYVYIPPSNSMYEYSDVLGGKIEYFDRWVKKKLMVVSFEE